MNETKYNPNAIRELREAHGLTGAQFAARCGISRQHLHGIEAGRSCPSADTQALIITAFGCSPEIFFCQP